MLSYRPRWIPTVLLWLTDALQYALFIPAHSDLRKAIVVPATRLRWLAAHHSLQQRLFGL
ncbi:MAG: hypothetical protein CL927_20090 [Deltaproteobacteria bacterium]|nr:hypothetical protein [Deltaproteobacteria bacterium]